MKNSFINLLYLQYGRKDIESAQKKKSKEESDENGRLIKETGKSNKAENDIKYSTSVNRVKNGLMNGTNHVISRDDNLILVPEPIQKQSDEEKVSDDENQVCFIFYLIYKINSNILNIIAKYLKNVLPIRISILQS